MIEFINVIVPNKYNKLDTHLRIYIHEKISFFDI